MSVHVKKPMAQPLAQAFQGRFGLQVAAVLVGAVKGAVEVVEPQGRTSTPKFG